MKKHIVQLKNWILILVALLSFGGLSKDVKAASGNVYSCQIARTSAEISLFDNPLPTNLMISHSASVISSTFCA